MATEVNLVIREAPAKINLGLHVLRRRGDGYHDIETVMIGIGWSDKLSFSPQADWAFSCSDPSLPTDERNLCVVAAERFAAVHGISPSGRLRLEKRIPQGAGLGGGSSDAAATLKLLSQEWGIRTQVATFEELAAELGSDVPFFLADGPMIARGRGEHLEPLGRKGPYRMPFTVAVIMPPTQISTAEAYQFVRPTDEGRVDLRDLVLSNDLDRWRQELVNDFQAPVESRYPLIADERRKLLDLGAEYASLSGSGAAVYGLFLSAEKARSAADDARLRGRQAWSGPALTVGRQH